MWFGPASPKALRLLLRGRPVPGASLQARKKVFISFLAAGGQGNASSFPQEEDLSPLPGVCGMGM